MGLYPPDDPYLLRLASPIIVLVIIGAGFAGLWVWGWVAEQMAARFPATVDTRWKRVVGGVLVVVVVAFVALRLVATMLIARGIAPPDDPYLLVTAVPVQIRWYGVFIVSGVLAGGWLTARRAAQREINPEHVWNQLMLGLVLGIAGARVYYVVFEWDRFQGNLAMMLNLMGGGLAIHGAILGAILACVIYTRMTGLSFWVWLDTFVPGFLLAQGIGRWGNFFNQEAYGEPTSLGFGVLIDAAHRLPAYADLVRYPPDTLFHATFLYESIWNLTGVVLLLLLDRWYGTHKPTVRRWLRPGDILFLYAVYYSLGRVWIEGLRTDSLYLGPLRVAQVVSLSLMLAGVVALVINHRHRHGTASDKP